VRRERSGRALERRCRKLVDGLELPRPFDAAAFLRGLGRVRGRPIELIPVPARPDAPCGLLVTTERADYVMYTADTSPLHQQHILLHEAAHIVCGHHDGASVGPGAAALLPNLPASLIRSVLGRTVYTEPQEQEAELVASLLRLRAERHDAAPRGGTRLHALFDVPRDVRRG
jgi:hypothetical protein